VALALFALWSHSIPIRRRYGREFVVGENAGQVRSAGQSYWAPCYGVAAACGIAVGISGERRPAGSRAAMFVLATAAAIN